VQFWQFKELMRILKDEIMFRLFLRTAMSYLRQYEATFQLFTELGNDFA
jgi:hypothetical protein